MRSEKYDALGRLRIKNLGRQKDGLGNYTVTPLETQKFDYNIRGWLLGANRDYARDLSVDNYFGFDLGYDKKNNQLIGDKEYTSAQYNGNITGTVWKSKGDGEKRKYDFTYDAVNRLTGAAFGQYSGGVFNKSAGVDYSVTGLSYDANGNILKMNQYGLKGTSSVLIDQLTYTYLDAGNKLGKVADAIGVDHQLGDFTDGINTGNDYEYDVNGNLIKDENKSISSIQYNHLNLPSTVTVTNKGTISYIYDALGTKLKSFPS